ncbi:glycosyltransferase [Streptococcus sp.]|uniref:glycosyltransferase n=1 Tax=Streptococcus sp. TaxID=1306 RepID=UPI0025E508A8|nr:glycosyltransferase [Streptococcus sp.]MBS5350922.1 glycosyltransferase [Streptococcus sp.]
MTIYTFNLLVGYEPNGVDVAQASRALMLRELNAPAKFVFTTWPQPYKLDYYLSLGHRYEEFLHAYVCFTDQDGYIPSLTVGALQQQFQLTRLDLKKQDETEFLYEFSDGSSLIFTMDPYKKGCVRYVDYLTKGLLLKREWYGACKLITEYFEKGILIRRSFHNQDGHIAFEELKQGATWLYRLENEILVSQTEVMRRFLDRLSLTQEDTLLLDRAALIAFARPILELHSPAKLGFVFHSEHEFKNGGLYYEYYYIFKYAQRFDFFITATEAQKAVLETTLHKQGLNNATIYALPVGHLDSLSYPDSQRKPLSLITASRLDPRKRLDLAIRAVALAHDEEPNLHFDIYGKGVEQENLEQLIDDLGASRYIHLRGHANLQKVYPQYELYVTTSQWETFGLTLMEAVGAGLALVGFDARYGNPTFIKDGMNGYLVPYDETMDEDLLVSDMADKIVAVLEGDLESMHQASYDLAKKYLKPEILEAWRKLLVALD